MRSKNTGNTEEGIKIDYNAERKREKLKRKKGNIVQHCISNSSNNSKVTSASKCFKVKATK